MYRHKVKYRDVSLINQSGTDAGDFCEDSEEGDGEESGLIRVTFGAGAIGEMANRKA
jgi:hypothetical protein